LTNNYSYICKKLLKFTIIKKLIFILAIAAVLASCKTDELKVFQIDPNAMISIKPDAKAFKSQAMKVKATTGHLSSLEIVKQTTAIQINSFLFGKVQIGERGFESNQRDTISAIPCLKMYGLDIINSDGEYVHDFIESTDCILLKFSLLFAGAPRDTLAYIPNATLRAAEAIIKQAYADKDKALILKTFNEAFTFIPITGAEYKVLKAQGLQ